MIGSFRLIKTLHRIINGLTALYFTTNWRRIFTLSIPRLITCELPSLYQITIGNKCSSFPPPELVHVWTRLIVKCRTLLGVPGGGGRLGRFRQTEKKCVGEVSLPFPGGLNLLGFLTLILLTWRIWWAPNNASKLQMGFNSMFKGSRVPKNKNLKYVVH